MLRSSAAYKGFTGIANNAPRALFEEWRTYRRCTYSSCACIGYFPSFSPTAIRLGICSIREVLVTIRVQMCITRPRCGEVGKRLLYHPMHPRHSANEYFVVYNTTYHLRLYLCTVYSCCQLCLKVSAERCLSSTSSLQDLKHSTSHRSPEGNI